MSNATEILGQLSLERFRTLVEASPRKVREELFRSAGVRSKSSTYSLKSASKAARFEQLKGKLAAGEVQGVEAAEEVIRSYLGQRASLLADALDYFEVAHQNGFTDQDLDFMAKLEPSRVQAFWSHLEGRGHEAEDIDLYCRYMDVRRVPGS